MATATPSATATAPGKVERPLHPSSKKEVPSAVVAIFHLLGNSPTELKEAAPRSYRWCHPQSPGIEVGTDPFQGLHITFQVEGKEEERKGEGVSSSLSRIHAAAAKIFSPERPKEIGEKGVLWLHFKGVPNFSTKTCFSLLPKEEGWVLQNIRPKEEEGDLSIFRSLAPNGAHTVPALPHIDLGADMASVRVDEKTGEKEILLVRSRGKPFYSLPGGKVERNATLQQTAEAEVQEETNLQVHAQEIIGLTHFRDSEGLRITFKGQLASEGSPHPRLGEIEDARWIPLKDILNPVSQKDERGKERKGILVEGKFFSLHASVSVAAESMKSKAHLAVVSSSPTTIIYGARSEEVRSEEKGI